MSLHLLPAALKRRLLALRPAPPRDERAVFEGAERALYRLVEPMCAGLDAVEYAQRILTHPSHVLRDHALTRLQRQRVALRATCQAADTALASAIHLLEEANRETA